MKELEGKCALVTGSARGIGKKIAQELLRQGAKVAFCDVNEEEVAESAQETGEAGTGTLSAAVDVTDSTALNSFVDQVVKTWGRLDIMVNNAGITRDTLMLRMKDQDWQKVLDVNLTGTFYGCRAATKYMARQRAGRIVNIASITGLIGNRGQANYSASKGGVIALTKTVAREFASRNVTANAVAPGFIETDMTAVLSEQAKQSFLENIPLNRPGRPQDVANAVAFLASDRAAYITGQVLNVSGGMVM